MNKLEFSYFTYRCQNYIINNKLNNDDYDNYENRSKLVDNNNECDQICLLCGGRLCLVIGSIISFPITLCLDFITFPLRLIKFLINKQLINKNNFNNKKLNI